MMKVTRIALTFPKIIEDLKAVKYTQDLTGCAFDQRLDPLTCVAFPGTRVNNFTDGVFEDPMGQQGSVFTPTAPLPPGSPGFDINRILDIKWCPDQNYFQVMVAGDGPYTLPLILTSPPPPSPSPPEPSPPPSPSPSPPPPPPPPPASPPMPPGYLQIAGGYYMIESGSCGGALISTKSECEAAATALDLSDKSAAPVQGGAAYPPGCVWRLTTYLYKFPSSSTGACSSSNPCICKGRYSAGLRLALHPLPLRLSGLPW